MPGGQGVTDEVAGTLVGCGAHNQETSERSQSWRVATGRRGGSHLPFAVGGEEPGDRPVAVPLFMEPNVDTAEEMKLEEQVDPVKDAGPSDGREDASERKPGVGFGDPSEEVGLDGGLDAQVAEPGEERESAAVQRLDEGLFVEPDARETAGGEA
jgi:hypothetical protein